MLNAPFVLKIHALFSWLFGYEEKRFDEKANVNFKIYYVADWTTNNYSTYIVQYLKELRQPYS